MADRESGVRYDAFISYKHEKPDTIVAKDIQQGLERFSVPREVQKETGKKHIGRIFRDSEELSLTGDLSGEIQEALVQSRFMILICSGHTRESVWIDREIDFFLETHDENHILTVITEGEPSEVLPQRLLDQGREALSADYRIPRRKARHLELPRIAATLLGCTYDDLIQRTRQYYMRRLLTAAIVMMAVSAGAALYFFQSRKQIQQSLEEARIGQAKYIAGEVETLLSRDLDVTAAQLALYAVPEDKDLTPAQSIRALSDASGAYLPLTPDQSANVRVIGELHGSDAITLIRTNRDRTRIAAADVTGHIHVWDADTGEDILSLQEEGSVEEMAVTENMLIVGTGEQIVGYALSSGSRSWSIDRTVRQGDLMKTDDEETEVILSGKDDEGRPHLMSVDPEQGTVQKDTALPDGSEVQTAALSEDGRYAALCIRTGEAAGIWLYDFEAETLLQTGVHLSGQGKLCFPGDNSFIVRETVSGSDSERIRGSSLDGLLHTAGRTEDIVYRISSQTGDILWKSKIGYSFDDDTDMMAGTFVSDGKQEAIYITASNVLSVYDAQTGEEIHSYELPGKPLLIGETDTDSSTGSSLSAVCSDGSFALIDPSEEDFDYMNVFQSGISRAVYRETSDGAPEYLVHPDGSDVLLQYTTEYSDPDFEAFEGASGKGYPVFFAVTESSYIAVRDMADGENPVLEIYDRKTKALIRSLSVQGFPDTFYGLTGDQKEIVCARKGADMYAVSLKDGKAKALALSEKPSSESIVLMQEGILYYIGENGDFCTYDTKTQKTDRIKPEDDLSGRIDAAAWDSSSRRFAVAAGRNICVFDRKGSRIMRIPYSGAQAVGLYFYKNMLLAASGSGLIRYSLSDGRILGSVTLDYYLADRETEDTGCKWLLRGDGTLLLSLSDYVNVIDTEKWVTLYSIPQCLSYDTDSRIFVVCESPDVDTAEIGYFPEYTPDDLLRKCKEAGGDMQPDEEMLARYGISITH